MVVMAIITVVVGRLFGVTELFVLGAGFLTLALCCIFWVHLRPISLEVRRHAFPDQLQVGDTGRVELEVTNRARTTASLLSLWEPVSNMGGASLRLAPLRSGESASASYRLAATQRGTITFGPLVAERRDPFGLAGLRRVVAGSGELVVLPAHHRINVPTGSAGTGPLGNLLRVRSMSQTGTEFRSLREYVTGDDLRTVSWRASARTDTLVVREVEPEGLKRCTVVLDLDESQYDNDSFERAVSAAASTVVTVFQTSLKLRFVTGESGDYRNTDPAMALRRLADITTETEPSLNDAVMKVSTGEGLGLVVVITGNPSSPMTQRVARTIGPADALVTVACTSMSSASLGFVVDATADDMFAISWANLTGGTPV